MNHVESKYTEEGYYIEIHFCPECGEEVTGTPLKDWTPRGSSERYHKMCMKKVYAKEEAEREQWRQENNK